MLYGYMGKMLWVYLSTKELQEETLDETMARNFLGGYGFYMDEMITGNSELLPAAKKEG